MTTTDQPAGEPDTEGSNGASANFAVDFCSLTANIATVIKGKSTVIHLMALALIADGHVLVEDVPGIGKTSLGKALARSVVRTRTRCLQNADGLHGKLRVKDSACKAN